MEWLDRKPNTLEFHLAHPEVDSRSYVQSKRRAIGKYVSSLHRIYLDTKQWLQLRDVTMGRPRTQLHVEIFQLLVTLCSSGKVLCPISCSVFDELMLQSDENTRLATARVIDQLGKGYCCLNLLALAERELMYFMIQNTDPGNSLIPVIEAVWTKVAFIYGDVMPVSTGLSRDDENALQKTMDDLYLGITVEEVVTHLYDSYVVINSRDRVENQRLVVQLEDGKRNHANEHATFHDLLCAEIYGGLDAMRDILEKVVVEIAKYHGFEGPISESDREVGGVSIARLVASAFRHKKVECALPQIHIHSSLHAAARWDKTRKYKANDLEDYRHACVAIPYYNCFCTERSLRHVLCQELLRLDEVYGTKVIASDELFMEHLSSL